MKKYVFFSCSVFGVGGGQLYVSNKSEYLIDKGFQVYSISTSHLSYADKIFYKGLYQVQNIILSELEFCPEAYSAAKREKIINQIIHMISADESDEIVLESNNLPCAIWAERLAERLQCKHVFFSISEHNFINGHTLEFLEFKFKRGELATIGTKTFKRIYAKSMLITEQNIPTLRAYLGDYIGDETDERLENIQKSDYNVCIIGRGGKRYVEYACLSLAAFCQKHPTVSFTVGIVSKFRDDEKRQRILERFEAAANVKVYCLGYFSPIPRALFDMFDLYIGGAGCASLAYRQNVLTLAMDLYNDRPLGFMGYDVYKTKDVSEQDADMEAYLEDAFFGKEYLKKEYLPSPVMTAEEAFSRHDEFLENSSKEKEYFIKTNKAVSLKEKVKAKFPFLIKLYRQAQLLLKPSKQ